MVCVSCGVENLVTRASVTQVFGTVSWYQRKHILDSNAFANTLPVPAKDKVLAASRSKRGNT